MPRTEGERFPEACLRATLTKRVHRAAKRGRSRARHDTPPHSDGVSVYSVSPTPCSKSCIAPMVAQRLRELRGNEWRELIDALQQSIRPCAALVQERQDTRAGHVAGFEAIDLEACRRNDLRDGPVEMAASAHGPPGWREAVLPFFDAGIGREAVLDEEEPVIRRWQPKAPEPDTRQPGGCLPLASIQLIDERPCGKSLRGSCNWRHRRRSPD